MQELDKCSFILGMIAAFSECVAGGCKKLALSPPLTREDYEAVAEDAYAVIEKQGLLSYHEENRELPSEKRYEWILIASDWETIEQYLELRNQGNSPAKSLEPFYELLGYDPEARIETGYDAYKSSFPVAKKEIYLAGGCFWGLQKYFDQFPGILETEVGYANGPSQAPDYQAVCGGSGHAETLHIEYDEAAISLEEILDHYFEVIDPTSVNKQGNDAGIQYRTGIYYTEMAQMDAIRTVCNREREKAGKPLAVSVEPLKNFFRAEEEHQKYLEKNPGGYCHIPAEYFK